MSLILHESSRILLLHDDTYSTQPIWYWVTRCGKDGKTGGYYRTDTGEEFTYELLKKTKVFTLEFSGVNKPNNAKISVGPNTVVITTQGTLKSVQMLRKGDDVQTIAGDIRLNKNPKLEVLGSVYRVNVQWFDTLKAAENYEISEEAARIYESWPFDHPYRYRVEKTGMATAAPGRRFNYA